MNFIKGMAAGLLVGAAVTMLTDPVTDKQRHRLKKKANRMAHKLSCTLDNAMNRM